MSKKIIVLIGDKNNKRFTFFDKAIDKNIYSFISMDWNELDVDLLEKAFFVKIEPPIIESSNVLELGRFIEWYVDKLEFLSSLENVNYMNNPKAIINCLDKVFAKKLMDDREIPATKMIGYDVEDYDDFRLLIESERLTEVFIKPRYGSGASGIIAYRYNPKTKEEIIYTTMVLGEADELLNLKEIKKSNNHEYIKTLINAICKTGVVVERWEKKDR